LFDRLADYLEAPHEHCGKKRSLIDQELEIRHGQFFCRVCTVFVPRKSACQHVWGQVRRCFRISIHCIFSKTIKVVNDEQHGKGGTKHLELVAKAGPQQLTMVSTGNQVVLSAAARDEQGQTLSREQKMFNLQVGSFSYWYFF
jgi:hypothetical protein